MSDTFVQKTDNTLLPADAGGKERAFVWNSVLVFRLALISACLLAAPAAHAATRLVLQSAPTGIVLAGAGGGNYQSSFGTLNALGVPAAAPTAGVTILPLANGALYYTTYQLKVTGVLPLNANITGYVSSNFSNPSALVVQSCPSTQTCNSAGSFSTMPLSSGAAIDVVPLPGIPKNTLVTAGLAIFVPDNNGPTAFTGNDSAVITLTAFEVGIQIDQKTLSLNFPTESLVPALRLTLNSDPAGLTVSPGADFLMAFGNVNALGIGPGAGLTPVAHAGGIIYSTPYQIQPAFTDFSATSGTVDVYVSTDFANPLVLQLFDASGGAGPYNAISKSSGAQTLINNSYASRSINTRYLGLFVSNVNGPTAFTGTDQATLTYTLTVP